jgi:hypothetical protein
VPGPSNLFDHDGFLLHIVIVQEASFFISRVIRVSRIKEVQTNLHNWFFNGFKITLQPNEPVEPLDYCGIAS